MSDGCPFDVVFVTFEANIQSFYGESSFYKSSVSTDPRGSYFFYDESINKKHSFSMTDQLHHNLCGHLKEGKGMLGKTLRNVLLGSGLAATVVSFAPAAFAGAGGVAGSAAFNLVDNGSGTQVVAEVATAASVGKNGASAWAFQTDTTNSAGAIGSGGVITISGMTATTFTDAKDAADAALYTAQDNTFAAGAGPDVQLGTTSGNVVVNSP